jgi:imidazolonepropionase-like amidohydrolase
MVNYGMLPMDVIHSATVMGAKLLRKTDELGQIKETPTLLDDFE